MALLIGSTSDLGFWTAAGVKGWLPSPAKGERNETIARRDGVSNPAQAARH
jgi:hypothetical protein